VASAGILSGRPESRLGERLPDVENAVVKPVRPETGERTRQEQTAERQSSQSHFLWRFFWGFQARRICSSGSLCEIRAKEAIE
jgi:hypothetical protein